MDLLALHGFTGRGGDFAPFAKLVGGNWHCPDLPGHGPSPQLDCSPKATSVSIQQAARSLTTEKSPRILLGYSMGARAALQYALEDPNGWDALILISPNPGIEHEQQRAERRKVDNKLADCIERDGVLAFIEFWQNTPMIRSQKLIQADWREAMQASRAQHCAKGLACSLRQFGQGCCPNLWPDLFGLSMPLLLLTGAQDIKYHRIATRMADLLPQAQHIDIPSVGHMPHLEAPEQSADIINRFVNEL